ncbi:MAG TPA: antibiotic biosynthesis monooxygenase [Bacillaceae bacterium]
MYTYITTGTYEFLKGLAAKYPQEKMLIMQNAQVTQLWHETNGQTVFQAPRKYEVIGFAGELATSGFVACNNIPVRDEGRPLFEYGFTNQAKSIEKESGFKAMRVLRPLSSDTYVVMTMWEDEKSFESWKSSQAFKDAHKMSGGAKSTENKGIMAGPSYVATFVVSDDELERPEE